MSNAFDLDGYLDSVSAFTARIGGEEVEFVRLGMMSAADRKTVKPLTLERERLFREMAASLQEAANGKADGRLAGDIDDDITAVSLAVLKAACKGSAAVKKKLDALPQDAVSRLYAEYTARAELGEASPSPNK